MRTTKQRIPESVVALKGLQLSIARRAADMRVFHFGRVAITDKGSVGEFALHIQCPWRIEGPAGIVTGRSDLWQPVAANVDIDLDTWDYDADGNVQDEQLGALIGGYDLQTRSSVNDSGQLIVEAVDADE